MSMEYVRKNYGVPAYRGGKVAFIFAGKRNIGRITSADYRIKVAPEKYQYPNRSRLIFHPTDLEYLSGGTQNEGKEKV